MLKLKAINSFFVTFYLFIPMVDVTNNWIGPKPWLFNRFFNNSVFTELNLVFGCAFVHFQISLCHVFFIEEIQRAHPIHIHILCQFRTRFLQWQFLLNFPRINAVLRLIFNWNVIDKKISKTFPMGWKSIVCF